MTTLNRECINVKYISIAKSALDISHRNEMFHTNLSNNEVFMYVF